MRSSPKSLVLLALTATSLALPPAVSAASIAHSPVAASPAREVIAPYRARFGRARPVIAIIGENSGTELTDFVIPFGVLSEAAVGDVMTVATRPGPMTMRPALHINPQATVREFDVRFPQGADYVIVPAVVKRDDPTLLTWIAAQAAKGSTIVSICDGALVVANTGLLNGHRATAHWATRDLRLKAYPAVHWVENARYVADGRIVSSAGISAAIPTALALVEAIGGSAKAAIVARSMHVADWSSAHNNTIFAPKLGRNIMAFATTNYLNGWFHKTQSVGVSISPGVDEMALALTADAYSRTGRSKAYAIAVSPAPVRTRHGLVVTPDCVANGAQPVDRVVSMSKAPTPVFDAVLANIARDYGRSTAFGVALDFEYPGYHD